jgi:myo-inositol 2-dehydrogenase/D-chiro-inositol 1-dehydrogenase
LAEVHWRQNRAFLHFVRAGEFSSIASDCWDGYAAAIVGETGVRALDEGRKAAVEMAATPGFYARSKESAR